MQKDQWWVYSNGVRVGVFDNWDHVLAFLATAMRNAESTIKIQHHPFEE